VSAEIPAVPRDSPFGGVSLTEIGDRYVRALGLDGVSQGLKAASQFDTTTIEVVAAGSSDTVIRNRCPVGETL
jgi:hypothetical protein